MEDFSKTIKIISGFLGKCLEREREKKNLERGSLEPFIRPDLARLDEAW